MNHLLYLTGRPCAGKSTLAAALTDGCSGFSDMKPFAHTVWIPAGAVRGSTPVVELGVRRPQFSGTDTLPMNVAPKVRAWCSEATGPLLVLGEGDRLGSGSFLDHVRGLDGWTVVHVSLDLDDGAFAVRMAGRPDWSPNPSWLAGRVTKSSNLAAVADLRLDATLPVDLLVEVLVTSSVVAATLRSYTPVA